MNKETELEIKRLYMEAGKYYDDFTGIHDYEKSAPLLLKCLELDDPDNPQSSLTIDACMDLGYIYMSHNELDKALKYFLLYEKFTGDNMNSIEIGSIYETGVDGVPDYEKALEYYDKGGETIKIAEFYEKGLGVEKDLEKAMSIYGQMGSLPMKHVKRLYDYLKDGIVVNPALQEKFRLEIALDKRDKCSFPIVYYPACGIFIIADLNPEIDAQSYYVNDFDARLLELKEVWSSGRSLYDIRNWRPGECTLVSLFVYFRLLFVWIISGTYSEECGAAFLAGSGWPTIPEPGHGHPISSILSLGLSPCSVLSNIYKKELDKALSVIMEEAESIIRISKLSQIDTESLFSEINRHAAIFRKWIDDPDTGYSD